MSLQTLPILFINLGGEMMYILDQRLRAQNIPAEKAKKVLHDIVGTMFNKRFMEELFKPQELYSKKAMRTVFDRLAHASIMRLNAPSMDKLYDLMTMAFKYQVSLSLRPNDILLVTLNHMDAIRHFVEDSQPIRQQVDYVYRLLIQTYASKTSGQFQLVRQTLLNFFQDMHIRVSIFLKDKVQNTNGRFALSTNGPVPWGCEIPGTIRLFNCNGEQTKSLQFPTGGRYTNSPKEGSYDPKGDRVTKLGTNMYNVTRPIDTTTSNVVKTSTPSSAMESVPPDPLAKAQLDLLSALIGGSKTTEKQKFRLNLFNNDKEEGEAAIYKPISTSASANVVQIDATKRSKNAELTRIMGELHMEGETTQDEDDDLLDLMDRA